MTKKQQSEKKLNTDQLLGDSRIVNRRSFIKRAVLGVTGVSAVPAVVFATTRCDIQGARTATVLDYGADATGKIDSSSSFNKAPTGTFIPNGVYKINAPITTPYFSFDDNVTLIGTHKLAPKCHKQYDTRDSNMFLAAFGADPQFGIRPMGLHSSVNGWEWRHLGNITKDRIANSFDWADPCPLYDAETKKFYISITYENTGAADFGVMVSDNLLDWDFHKCQLGRGLIQANTPAPGWTWNPGASGVAVWGPSWFKDPSTGNLYVILFVQTQANQVTVESASQPFFRPYIAQCTNLSALTFGPAIELQIEGKLGPSQCSAQDNRIDSHIIYLSQPAGEFPAGTYIMTMKDEYNKWINIYSASSLTGNWTLRVKNVFSNVVRVGDVPFTEGPCITPFVYMGALKYLILCDKYYDNKTFYTTTADFKHFDFPLSIKAQTWTRHGYVINYGLLTAPEFLDVDNKVVNAAAKLVAPVRSDIISYRDIKDLQGFPDFKNSRLIPDSGTLYKFKNNTQYKTVVFEAGFANSNEISDGTYFFMQVEADNYFINTQPLQIIIPEHAANINSINGTIILGQQQGNAGVIYKFTKLNGQWCIETKVDKLNLTERNIGVIQLEKLEGYPQINASKILFWPIHGWTYQVNSDQASVVIYSLPTGYKNGAFFYLWTQTGSSAKGCITLKMDKKSNWLTSDLLIDNRVGGKLVKVVLVNGKWAIEK